MGATVILKNCVLRGVPHRRPVNSVFLPCVHDTTLCKSDVWESSLHATDGITVGFSRQAGLQCAFLLRTTYNNDTSFEIEPR